MKLVASEDQSHTLSVDQFKFGRDTNTWSVFTYVQKKKFRFTFDKRAVNSENFSSLPFGY
jgi:hypothetical protein